MATRLVVEWTRTSLRLALARGSGARWRLRSIAAQPLEPSGDVAERLRAFMKSLKAAPDEVVSVVSREQVITRVVKFPTVQPEELAQMTELYARGQLPYPREQVVTDSYVLSQADGVSIVAMVACLREAVDRQVAVLREAGCPTSLVTVSSWGALGWYRLLGKSAASNEPTLVINIDDSRSDFVLIAGGRILSSRSVGQGTRDWQVSSEVVELLKLEVDRSRAAVRKELPGTDVRSVLLTGLGVAEPWKDALAQSLGLPVVLQDALAPWKGATISPAAPISPVVVGGIACSDARQLLNISPLELRGQVRHRRQVRELSLVSLLIASVLAAGTGLLAVRSIRQRQFAAQLEQLLAEVEPTVRRLQEHLRIAGMVESVLDERRDLAGLIAGVFQATPAEILLEAIVFERTRRELAMRGSAPSTQAVLDYQAGLSRVEGAARVELKYTQIRSTPAGERTDFEMIIKR
ncbi:MAG: hypothetical protein COV75_03905 [Candidatus Omnitrophica bacterium CG11_big_fil_rev_8_21_14_0_20_63_9]|nr:MAG: hypothetical protein COV75_03905 [Candidatus Omnitrophica bacterium CG11_big_fil_rev_8_21_14_0_20_63_9]